MSSVRAFVKRRWLPVGSFAAILAAGAIYALTAGAATPIPVPDAVVVVTTKSVNVTKTHLAPIGGAPIPIDVDRPTLLGVLKPDIDVSVRRRRGQQGGRRQPARQRPGRQLPVHHQGRWRAPGIANPISPAAPDGSNGFYISTPSVSGTSTDAHSGVARVEQQIDEGDWASASPAPVAEGVHTVRTRAFDVAGNPSQILERRVFVDRSDPSSKLVSFPPVPNSRGWYRRTLKDSIAVSDGRDGSGPNSATFTVNGGGPSTYLAPFEVGHGVNSVGVRARDVAGRQGALVSQTQKIDTIAPAGAPVGQTRRSLPCRRSGCRIPSR